MGMGAPGFGLPGAPGFSNFDFTQMSAYNPYMFGFPGAGAAGGGLSPTSQQWAFSSSLAGMPASMLGASAASFHAPGAKNEIKLFVGGL